MWTPQMNRSNTKPGFRMGDELEREQLMVSEAVGLQHVATLGQSLVIFRSILAVSHNDT